MKSFFQLVFGGLAAVTCGVAIVYAFINLGDRVGPTLRRIHLPSISNLASAISLSSFADGTTVTGMVRSVRYTASQEEDLINAAAQTLPKGFDDKITATAYLIKNITRGNVIVSYSADRLLPIASISKLVTAVVARKLIRPSERITITAEVMRTYGNTAQFRTGETFTADDLYYPLLMVSSNDAAEALARFYGRPEFIKAMNDFAQSIGAYRTYFVDPSGLSPLNVSTADDLVTILTWMQNNDPAVLDITKLKSKIIRSHTFINPTHFLSWSNYLGGKNGYIPEANRTGVGLFTVGILKDVYATVVLGSAARDPDVIKLLQKIKP